MSARKLKLVGFSKTQIDFDDDSELASLVAHLDEKFFNKRSEDWHLKFMDEKNKEAFAKSLEEYLVEFGIDFSNDPSISRLYVCDNLLSQAVDVIYNKNENVHNYTSHQVSKLREARISSAESSKNPLNTIDCTETNIRTQIVDLCKSLGIIEHPNPEVMLRAACQFIEENLAEDEIRQRANEEKEAKPRNEFSFKNFPVGLDDQKDAALNSAARCLRLLSVASLRETQTRINETLAAIQNLTMTAKK
ncbi:unnamed protein product, partial [Mesorhabditis belari]|uniref:Uncharacterized protein n=1 Tax=Mesorhabditis belari TaxID=2138241 RepID=A0AAF3F0I0_9BILA